jgi:elongation factor 1-gamma
VSDLSSLPQKEEWSIKYSTAIAQQVLVLTCYCFLQGRVEQWIDFANNEVDSYITRWLHPRIGLLPYVPAVSCVWEYSISDYLSIYKLQGSNFYVVQSEQISIGGLMRSLDALNTYLASTTFLVGHSVTLADIVMTCNLYSGFRWILNKDFI